MTDKEYKKQVARVRKYLDKWQKPCGFGWWTIEVEYSRERDEDVAGTFAQCWSYWQYRSGTLRFFLPVVANCTDEQVEQNVLHELCHLIVSPLENFDSKEKRQITEYTTTLVAEALYWAHTQVKKGRSNVKRTIKIKTPHEVKASEEHRDIRTESSEQIQETGIVSDATRGKSGK
jgi:hypothetical protein